jgi:hypothetical protein
MDCGYVTAPALSAPLREIPIPEFRVFLRFFAANKIR